MPQAKKRKSKSTAATQQDPYDSDDSDVCSQGQATFQRREANNFEFPDVDETKLVQFYEANDCFYNKQSDDFGNHQHKECLLAQMASELHCECKCTIFY